MNTALKVLKADDFASDQDIRWCPGCGDYSILAQMKKVLPALGIPREKMVFVSGIGCSSRFPYSVTTYGMHSIHGRAPAVATGLKSVRPDLTVWELTMRSWHLLYDFAPEAYASAKTLLERALAIDPESAEANMVLSLINHHIAILGFAPDPRPAMEAAYALGRRATQLDDRNEYAHWALGISCWGLQRLDEGIAALERAA